MKTKRALITGGAGFIGHHLTRLLLDKCWQVLILDNFSFGRHENIASFKDMPNFSLTVADLADEKACLDAVKEFRPGVVFHLAAVHFIPYCDAHPSETIKVNVLGTQHLLEAARAVDSVRRFIFVSTADIYQLQAEPNIEDQTPVGGFNIYGVSKLMGEDLIKHYVKLCPQVTFIIGRLFNTYGTGETNSHVIPDILDHMRNSDRLSLGNVVPKRDYIYVEDVAEALLALSENTVNESIVNIATGKEYSVRELVLLMAEITGRDLEIVLAPDKLRASERMNLLGNIDKIHRLTQWHPKHGLKEGLTKLLKQEGFLGSDEKAALEMIVS